MDHEAIAATVRLIFRGGYEFALVKDSSLSTEMIQISVDNGGILVDTPAIRAIVYGGIGSIFRIGERADMLNFLTISQEEVLTKIYLMTDYHQSYPVIPDDWIQSVSMTFAFSVDIKIDWKLSVADLFDHEHLRDLYRVCLPKGTVIFDGDRPLLNRPIVDDILSESIKYQIESKEISRLEAIRAQSAQIDEETAQLLLAVQPTDELNDQDYEFISFDIAREDERKKLIQAFVDAYEERIFQQISSDDVKERFDQTRQAISLFYAKHYAAGLRDQWEDMDKAVCEREHQIYAHKEQTINK